MIKRVVEISSPAWLSLKRRQMVIEREGVEPVTVPVEDLGVLILDHPAVTHTQGLLVACFENNVAVLVCGRKHLPGAVLLPLEGNSLQSETMEKQTGMAEPIRKRMWRDIVRAKILAQANALAQVAGDPGPLPAYAARVRSGDPENIEAQAARVYWQRLFGGSFRRDPEEEGINSLLNYGYAVLRAAVARAVVSTGLHPSIGIHHKNRYNSFCLADDLLEPVRPLVDAKTHELAAGENFSTGLAAVNKRAMLSLLGENCTISGRRLPLMTALHFYAAGARRVICGDDKEMEMPGL